MPRSYGNDALRLLSSVLLLTAPWYPSTDAYTGPNQLLKTLLPSRAFKLHENVKWPHAFLEFSSGIFDSGGVNSMRTMQLHAKKKNLVSDHDDDYDGPFVKLFAKAFIIVVGSVTIYKCMAFLLLVIKAFHQSATLAGWIK